MPRPVTVTAIVEGQQVTGFISGNIESSMITPADRFVLRLPVTELAWRTLRRGARISIRADSTTLLDGFIDRRDDGGRSDVMEIHGRDRVGRLCDESAPAIDYSGMTITEAVRRLASPWFSSITLSDARNRRLRVGKGRRVAAGSEDPVTIGIRVPRRGRVHPGETRWQMIHEICERAGLICYSSSDGKELFMGHPNQHQDPQYLFALTEPGSMQRTTVRDMKIVEDDGDRFSMIMVAGVGGQSDTNYGENVIDNRGVAFDNPFNKLDGTGRDFIHPKRLFMPERAFDSYRDAERVAQDEQDKRDFHRHQATVEMAGWGQLIGGGSNVTFFAPDTVAHVIREKTKIDDNYMVVSCSYSFSRDEADTTNMLCVPVGTVIGL